MSFFGDFLGNWQGKFHDFLGKIKKGFCWTPNYEGNGYVSIPEWKGKVGDTIEFEFLCNQISSSMPIIDGFLDDGVTVGVDVYVYREQLFFTSSVIDVTLNGFQVTSPHKIKANVLYKLKGVLKKGNITKHIGANRNLSGRLNGTIKNIKFTTQDGSDNRHYPSVITSETQPTGLVLENVLDEVSGDKWTPDYTGSHGYVRVPEWIVDDHSWSVKAKVVFNKTEDYQWVFTAGALGTNQFLQCGAFNDTWRLGYYGNDLNILEPKIILGQEYEVEYFFDGTDRGVIVDGVEIARQKMSTLVNTRGGAYIGSGVNGSYNLDGKIWDIKLTDNTNPSNSRYYPSVITSDSNPDSLYLEETLAPNLYQLPDGSGLTDFSMVDGVARYEGVGRKYFSNSLDACPIPTTVGEVFYCEMTYRTTLGTPQMAWDGVRGQGSVGTIDLVGDGNWYKGVLFFIATGGNMADNSIYLTSDGVTQGYMEVKDISVKKSYGALTGFTSSRVIPSYYQPILPKRPQTKPAELLETKATNGIWQSLGTTHGTLKNFPVGKEWKLCDGQVIDAVWQDEKQWNDDIKNTWDNPYQVQD